MNIGEPILQEGQTLVWDNLYSESVFHLPFALQGNQTLIHICCDVRMDVQRKSLYLQFVDQVVNLTLQSIRKKDGWLYATFPEAGGIIVVDFIDMNLAENRQKLYERMCQNMQKDRAKHNILPLSKFGLMQITRQRVRPAMDVNHDNTTHITQS